METQRSVDIIDIPKIVKKLVSFSGIILLIIYTILISTASFSLQEKTVILTIFALFFIVIGKQYLNYRIQFDYDNDVILFNKWRWTLKRISADTVLEWGFRRESMSRIGSVALVFYCVLTNGKKFDYVILEPIKIDVITQQFKKILKSDPKSVTS